MLKVHWILFILITMNRGQILLLSAKQTICDAKHWFSGETAWRKMWSKIYNIPQNAHQMAGGSGKGNQHQQYLVNREKVPHPGAPKKV